MKIKKWAPPSAPEARAVAEPVTRLDDVVLFDSRTAGVRERLMAPVALLVACQYIHKKLPFELLDDAGGVLIGYDGNRLRADYPWKDLIVAMDENFIVMLTGAVREVVEAATRKLGQGAADAPAVSAAASPES